MGMNEKSDLECVKEIFDAERNYDKLFAEKKKFASETFDQQTPEKPVLQKVQRKYPDIASGIKIDWKMALWPICVCLFFDVWNNFILE